MTDGSLLIILTAIGGLLGGVLIAWFAIRKVAKGKEGRLYRKLKHFKEAEAEAEVLKKNKSLKPKKNFSN